MTISYSTSEWRSGRVNTETHKKKILGKYLLEISQLENSHIHSIKALSPLLKGIYNPNSLVICLTDVKNDIIEQAS